MNVETKRKLVKDLIKATNGKFFAVTFVKKDGSVREMQCRTGVTKHLRGGDSTTAHKDNLITVFDTVANAYRCINADTVTRIAVSGNVVEIR